MAHMFLFSILYDIPGALTGTDTTDEATITSYILDRLSIGRLRSRPVPNSMFHAIVSLFEVRSYFETMPHKWPQMTLSSTMSRIPLSLTKAPSPKCKSVLLYEQPFLRCGASRLHQRTPKWPWMLQDQSSSIYTTHNKLRILNILSFWCTSYMLCVHV